MANIPRRNRRMLLLEPQVIRGLSHNVNLGIAFLQENNLKLVCTGEEVALMPVNRFSLESEASGRRMHQLQESEVREDMESNKRTRDINPNLESSM